jgi:hypothetical protein
MKARPALAPEGLLALVRPVTSSNCWSSAPSRSSAFGDSRSATAVSSACSSFWMWRRLNSTNLRDLPAHLAAAQRIFCGRLTEHVDQVAQVTVLATQLGEQPRGPLEAVARQEWHQDALFLFVMTIIHELAKDVGKAREVCRVDIRAAAQARSVGLQRTEQVGYHLMLIRQRLQRRHSQLLLVSHLYADACFQHVSSALPQRLWTSANSHAVKPMFGTTSVSRVSLIRVTLS